MYPEAIPYNNVTRVLRGQTAELRCPINLGRLTGVVTWIKTAPSPTILPNLYNYPNYNLVIASAATSDGGSYKCRIQLTGSQETKYSDVVTLEVHGERLPLGLSRLG